MQTAWMSSLCGLAPAGCRIHRMKWSNTNDMNSLPLPATSHPCDLQDQHPAPLTNINQLNYSPNHLPTLNQASLNQLFAHLELHHLWANRRCAGHLSWAAILRSSTGPGNGALHRACSYGAAGELLRGTTGVITEEQDPGTGCITSSNQIRWHQEKRLCIHDDMFFFQVKACSHEQALVWVSVWRYKATVKLTVKLRDVSASLAARS